MAAQWRLMLAQLRSLTARQTCQQDLLVEEHGILRMLAADVKEQRLVLEGRLAADVPSRVDCLETELEIRARRSGGSTGEYERDTLCRYDPMSDDAQRGQGDVAQDLGEEAYPW